MNSIDVEVLTALANEIRIEILEHLGKKELNANQVADRINLSRPAVSHHLQVLKRSSLVFARREGKEIFYSVNEDCLRNLASCLLNFVAMGEF